MNFDEMMRARAKAEDCPTPEGFESRLNETLAVLPERGKTRRTAPLRTVLLVAAVCAVLCLTAVALSPTLREALSGLLGSFERYSSEVEGISVTDNGIRVRVLSTLADENDGTVYFEVTDLEGDRLDESTVYNRYIRYGLCTAYDAETHTALFAYPIKKQNRNEDGTATISIHNFMSGMREFEGIKLPQELITNQLLESMPAPEEPERLVLKPNQTPAKLDSDYFSLSSMGFDTDGVFHIQIALADGVWLEEDGDISTASFELDWDATWWLEPHILFGEGKYLDIAYMEFTVERFGQFRADDLSGFLYTGEKVEGDWELTFPLKILPERVVTSNLAFQKTHLTSFHLTAMTLRLEAIYDDPDYPAYLAAFPVSLFLNDGTVLHLEYADWDTIYKTEDGEMIDGGGLSSGVDYGGKERCGADYLWSFPGAVDPQTVEAVAIGQRYIPFDGDTTGEGSWLPKVP